MAWRYGSDQVGGVSDPTFSSLFSVHQGEWGFGELCVAISISYGVSGCVAWVSTEPSIDANISSLSNLFFTSVHDDRSPGDTVASDRDDGMDLGSISGCGTRVARTPIYVWMRRAMIGNLTLPPELMFLPVLPTSIPPLFSSLCSTTAKHHGHPAHHKTPKLTHDRQLAVNSRTRRSHPTTLTHRKSSAASYHQRRLR